MTQSAVPGPPSTQTMPSNSIIPGRKEPLAMLIVQEQYLGTVYQVFPLHFMEIPSQQ